MMLITQLMIVSGSIIVLLLISVVYFWNKYRSYAAVLSEGAKHYEELNQRCTKYQTELSQLQIKDKNLATQIQEIENLLNLERSKCAEFSQKLKLKEHETVLFKEKIELQKTYLEQQLVKSKAIIAKLNTNISTIDAEYKTKIESNNIVVKNLEEAQSENIKKLQTLEKNVKKVNVDEIKKTKRKLSSYMRLYKTMKGLKEMADERNENWEIALKKLSTWVLSNNKTIKTKNKYDSNTKLAHLVADALNSVGAQLIDNDEFSVAQIKGGTSSKAEVKKDIIARASELSLTDNKKSTINQAVTDSEDFSIVSDEFVVVKPNGTKEKTPLSEAKTTTKD